MFKILLLRGFSGLLGISTAVLVALTLVLMPADLFGGISNDDLIATRLCAPCNSGCGWNATWVACMGGCALIPYACTTCGCKGLGPASCGCR
jgi:hypothetical protein